ncbi:hypothetical protein FK498_06225 [Elioraea sp. Yellowstone]|jgi:hypothetical protein|uniref:Rap1a/Tai family immunity protein n=1 Tax=Elioraea sp. Yellowstone TaxID=2592070 RepID=UPI001150C6EC|nr:Rap1a/Tai family immunity protein [Elioraea sp. Yellowstone]TQF80505.1 hypothetical protein FK498_06225 [Elioraea sp. Yellowstone]
MRRATAAMAAALVAAGTAWSQPKPLEAGRFEVKTLADLVEICRVAPGDPHSLEAIGYCNGYGRGALDYHRAVVPAHAPPLFCAPPGTAPEALRSRFIAWADANPDRLSGPAVEGVFAFLATTYPCPGRRR